MFKPNKIKLSLFLVVLSVAIYISFYCFQTQPAFWFDEGIFFQVVKNWALNNQLGVPLSPDSSSDLSLISMGYPVLAPAVSVFKIFGPSLVALRIVAISFLIGLIAVAFFLAKRLYGYWAALGIIFLLSVFSPLYGNGKSFLGEVPGLFFFSSALLMLLMLEKAKEKKIILGFLSGVLFGFAISAKPLYILIAPALLLAIIWRWRIFLEEKNGRWNIVAGFICLI